MKNILTIGSELMDHLNEEFEISELADLPTMSVSVLGNSAGSGGEVDEKTAQEVMTRYRFGKILPTLGVGLTLMGYVKDSEFFVFSVMLRDEGIEMSPTRRASFMELFNTNQDNIRLRHVPVNPTALTFPGALEALKSGHSPDDVLKFTQKALIELSGGVSPMTGLCRKGLAFKSTSTNFSFKVLSEDYMMGIA